MWSRFWRVPSEILTLQWHQVDFDAGVVRLEPGKTKNREGRLFPFTDELRTILEMQWADTASLQRRPGRIIPIKSLYGPWRSACDAAGGPGRMPHDFRRTPVRNLERAGVSRSVAMKLTGHKTESIYRRYAIVAEQDLKDGVAKLALLHQKKSPRVPPALARLDIAAAPSD